MKLFVFIVRAELVGLRTQESEQKRENGSKTHA